MSKLYENNIELTAGFKYTAEKPLDDRVAVESKADLDTLVTSHAAYDCMVVSVKDDGLYSYNKSSNSWTRLPGKHTAEGGEIFNNYGVAGFGLFNSASKDSHVEGLNNKNGVVSGYLISDMEILDNGQGTYTLPSIQYLEAENVYSIYTVSLEDGSIVQNKNIGKIISIDSTNKKVTVTNPVPIDFGRVQNIFSVDVLSTFSNSNITTCGTAPKSHIEGYNNKGLAANVHIEGHDNTSYGECSHIEGNSNISYAPDSHIENYKNTAGLCGIKILSTTEENEDTRIGTFTIAEKDLQYISINKSYLILSIDDTKYDIALHAFIRINSISGNIITYYRPKDYHSSIFNKTDNNTLYLTNQNLVAVKTYGDFAEFVDQGYRFPVSIGDTPIIELSGKSHIEGYNNSSHGYTSHTEGYNNSAMGQYSHSEGNNNISYGNSSHAEGYQCSAIGSQSHAEGNSNTSYGYYSHSEGINNIAEGVGSHVEGGALTVFNPYFDLCGKRCNFAEGDYSHSEGTCTRSSGDSSHAEGIFTYTGLEECAKITSASSNTTNSKYTDLVIDTDFYGGVSDNIFIGSTESDKYIDAKIISIDSTKLKITVDSEYDSTYTYSYIISPSYRDYGYITHGGKAAHAEGLGTIAGGDYQHVEGKFNNVDFNNYAHIVGNGKSVSERSNAYTLDWNGNAWFAGDVTATVAGKEYKISELAASSNPDALKAMIIEVLKTDEMKPVLTDIIKEVLSTSTLDGLNQ